jgi:hypothetical protein
MVGVRPLALTKCIITRVVIGSSGQQCSGKLETHCP